MTLAHMRHRTRIALLLLLLAFTAALSTRTYGQVAGAQWAFILGDLCLRGIILVVGVLIIAGVLLDPGLAVELRARRSPAGQLRRTETLKWVLIGCLLAASGLLLIINLTSALFPR